MLRQAARLGEMYGEISGRVHWDTQRDPSPITWSDFRGGQVMQLRDHDSEDHM